MKYVLVLSVVAAAFLLVAALYRGLRSYLKFRGQRIVSCPETHQAAAVRVASGTAAIRAMAGANQQLSLSTCSRWPNRQDCPQQCLAQIQEAPKACLAWTIMNQWYRGQTCAYCHKPFQQIHWHDHPPALLDSDRMTVEWNQIPPENLQQTLATHWPVCWSCHMAETFRREHPELVVNRPTH